MAVIVAKTKAEALKRKESYLSVALRRLLKSIKARNVVGDTSLSIKAIKYDSRAVEPGDLFVAIKGFQTDGHNFIAEALQKGAKVIVA